MQGNFRKLQLHHTNLTHKIYKKRHGETALHYAARFGYQSLVSLLLSTGGTLTKTHSIRDLSAEPNINRLLRRSTVVSDYIDTINLNGNELTEAHLMKYKNKLILQTKRAVEKQISWKASTKVFIKGSLNSINRSNAKKALGDHSKLKLLSEILEINSLLFNISITSQNLSNSKEKHQKKKELEPKSITLFIQGNTPHSWDERACLLKTDCLLIYDKSKVSRSKKSLFRSISFLGNFTFCVDLDFPCRFSILRFGDITDTTGIYFPFGYFCLFFMN